MSVDGTKDSFDEICSRRLPGHFRVVRERMADPFPMKRMAERGVGVKFALKEIVAKYGLNSKYEHEDFKGAYVFLEQGAPVYVGISQTVVARLNQHVKGKTHYDASLAYRIAKQKMYGKTNAGGANNRRQQNMADETFQSAFSEAKSKIAGYGVAVIEIDNAIERYLFAVYAAMELGTGKYNSFETH